MEASWEVPDGQEGNPRSPTRAMTGTRKGAMDAYHVVTNFPEFAPTVVAVAAARAPSRHEEGDKSRSVLK